MASELLSRVPDLSLFQRHLGRGRGKRKHELPLLAKPTVLGVKCDCVPLKGMHPPPLPAATGGLVLLAAHQSDISSNKQGQHSKASLQHSRDAAGSASQAECWLSFQL